MFLSVFISICGYTSGRSGMVGQPSVNPLAVTLRFTPPLLILTLGGS